MTATDYDVEEDEGIVDDRGGRGSGADNDRCGDHNDEGHGDGACEGTGQEWDLDASMPGCSMIMVRR